MIAAQLPLLIGFVVMALGSLAVYAHGSSHPEIRHHTNFHSLVCFIAATAYLAMATGMGRLEEADGGTLYLARYLDWSVTTPILLTGLVLTGLHEHDRHSGFILPVIVLDVVMILTGLMSAVADTGFQQILWYTWSCIAFAGVLYLLWLPIRSISRAMGGRFDVVYRKNLAFLTIVWLGYPLVFLLGPQGFGTLSEVADVWTILVLDIVAKVIYGFVSTARFKAMPNPELQREAAD